jgi:hypothetical protein
LLYHLLYALGSFCPGQEERVLSYTVRTRSQINDPVEVNCAPGFLTRPVADNWGKYYICCNTDFS